MRKPPSGVPLVGQQTTVSVLTLLAAGRSSRDAHESTGLPVELIEQVGLAHGWPLRAAVREALARMEDRAAGSRARALPRRDFSLDTLVAVAAGSARPSVHDAVRAVLVEAARLYRLVAPDTQPPAPPEVDLEDASVADIRTWARSAGLECPEHGPVPARVREAHRAAHDPGAAAEVVQLTG